MRFDSKGSVRVEDGTNLFLAGPYSVQVIVEQLEGSVSNDPNSPFSFEFLDGQLVIWTDPPVILDKQRN